MKNFLLKLSRYFVLLINYRYFFVFIIFLILILAVYKAYIGFDESVEFRRKAELEPNQRTLCGTSLRIYTERHTSGRQSSGAVTAKYFVLQSHDRGLVYFDSYPNDLTRLNIKNKQFPIYGNICVNYISFKNNISKLIITKVEFPQSSID
ncbi:hypothetical protein A7P53_13930 [Acinetobacter defluvii]|uniref:hypothetical protein n=1 Tax=Acinetobacter defluvii TaxID=1871111 RepID=UPI00148F6C68|nr:hypothetical protein [Acinetobacter defluvii]NNP73686.1 hypothetical protein [Acinetobacter defluvii]